MRRLMMIMDETALILIRRPKPVRRAVEVVAKGGLKVEQPIDYLVLSHPIQVLEDYHRGRSPGRHHEAPH